MTYFITQVWVPWWLLPLILFVLAIVMWVVVPRLHRGQDPDEWWGDLTGPEREKWEAVRMAFRAHYSTLHDCAWMDRVKMLEALDETAEVVKSLLEEGL